ncbi:DUF523 domain-containing protein [Clostridium sp. 19966]|uniref:DUF523 domain-containing protein n=1 Tax=Clostridium sp. 19966 TaxID=2768166 RepID=UPI0028E07B5E|nr:DUF523 domain-containing protein [Clostridium sp. 19966]MDT8716519.1 DUF523 domain-containing protein [Clostridium sp. 19966]
MILISACLMGVNCKYSGENNLSQALMNIIDKYEVIPVCPEQLGGLTTPRNPAEIFNSKSSEILMGVGKVIDNKENDRTLEFVKGAQETLYIAKKFNIKYAILKSNSPSCGNKKVYDGTFSGKIVAGSGVTAELLLENGIKVYNENELAEFEEDYNKTRE